jgi:acetyltransferase-like isoleucine patch superfamily enzyme
VTDPSAAEVLRRKLDNNRDRPPWELARKATAFAAATGRSHLQLRHATSVGIGVRILGRAPVVHNRGTLRLGNDVTLEARTRRIFFNVWSTGELVLADGVVVNDGARFDCARAIRIGERVMIGFGAAILDSHFHAVDDRTMRPTGRAITIGDDAWIAANAMILPGVSIGEGSVVAGGAVVPDDVAPFTVVAGNPARAVGSVDAARLRRLGDEG